MNLPTFTSFMQIIVHFFNFALALALAAKNLPEFYLNMFELLLLYHSADGENYLSSFQIIYLLSRGS